MGLLYSPHTCMYILTTCLLAMKVVANLCGTRDRRGGLGSLLHFRTNVTGRKMSMGRCLSSFKWP